MNQSTLPELSLDDSTYRRAFELSPDAFTITEIATGRYVDVNESFERLFGYPCTEVIGRRAMEFGIWADPGERAKLVEEITKNGFIKNFLAVGRHRDGSLRTCSLNGSVLDSGGIKRLILAVRDITDQVKTERALREALERFSKVFHSSPDAVLLSELGTGLIIEANEGFTKLSGYARDEIINHRLAELNLLERPGEWDLFVSEIKQQASLQNRELRMRARDGRERILLFTGELLEINARSHLLTVGRDLTAQKQASLEKAQLEAQLRRTQKLEALGTLAGGIAHDFNNILTASMAYTDFAKLDITQPDKVLEHLAEVQKANLRAQSLVRRILTFSRQQKQERRAIDIQIVIQEAIGLLRSTLPSSITISETYQPRPQIVLGDAGQIHQVVMNLGTNAAHAMKTAPGVFSIRVLCDRPPPQSPPSQDRRYVCVEISDTGLGMSPEVLKRVYEPFFTTKAPGEGTGLGLSVVHGIIHDHGGRIEVESIEGLGTTFHIFLPLDLNTPAKKAEPAADLPMGQGERILFLDDEPAICNFAHQLLTRLGYHVTTCCNPVEALAYFTGGKQEFDLVVTDLTMPELTGIDMASRLLSRHPGLPIILMSGFSGTWTQESVRAQGLLELLPKPLSLHSLACAVKRGTSSRQQTSP